MNNAEPSWENDAWTLVWDFYVEFVNEPLQDKQSADVC